MLPELIIRLLSNHRQAYRTELPQPLSLRAIATLIQQSLPPQYEDVSKQLEADLRELQAQGEVLAGMGNRFCMAPPVVLAEDEMNLTGVLFRGDRAYLRLAHQALETGQPSTRPILRPRINGFHRINERLRKVGIRLLTVASSVDHLPLPELPQPSRLQGCESLNPFEAATWTDPCRQYIPSLGTQQFEHWVPIMQAALRDCTLLKLPTGECIWFEAEQFYELTPDTALLAMFQLAQDARAPISIPWDEVPGRLNLQGISLPSSYAQLLWRLSQPDVDMPRTRLFAPANRPIAREALLRLGCTLV
ncbi:hypothetical protein L3556_13860 [Candidatus Synechococcus calcipolaris G9]|uniref:WYL domain-containing protein n=1 Tax=Candidatus Synechococcus calcipolaris G9 TaxID=1497997 RepID=A0ABT6F2C1_9SYNE|nr:hypothetical protein [Candidatus Synechococcus calcipolaris]MDG2992007.1 hypothetical protein [Candidatus Synechococcus calcipolaris G9]